MVGVDPHLVAVVLLVLGVAGSVVPLVPGALLSLAGVLGYWWATGFTSPGPLALALLIGGALLALAVDLFAGAVAAHAGGASRRTTLLAAVVGLALLPFAGPLGVVAGVALTVFAVEFRREDPVASLRTAGYATVGMLGSALVQALLTLAVLAGFLVAT